MHVSVRLFAFQRSGKVITSHSRCKTMQDFRRPRQHRFARRSRRGSAVHPRAATTGMACTSPNHIAGEKILLIRSAEVTVQEWFSYFRGLEIVCLGTLTGWLLQLRWSPLSLRHCQNKCCELQCIESTRQQASIFGVCVTRCPAC